MLVHHGLRRPRSLTAAAALATAVMLGTAGLILAATPAHAATDVAYLDANGDAQVAPSAIDLNGTQTIIGDLVDPDDWYVCNGIVAYADTLVVAGNAHLILADGCDMTVTAAGDTPGVDVSGAEHLTIYAQSAGPIMGRLTATGGALNAGIGSGGGSGAGWITINGGQILATGGGAGAGIGGGFNRPGGYTEINGGEVTALGVGGAGIGGGSMGSGGTVVIRGGDVFAESFGGTGTGGAGIGGGFAAAGARVTISGAATVDARGAGAGGSTPTGGGAGIGSGGTDGAVPLPPGTFVQNLTTGIVNGSGGGANPPAGAGAAFGEGGYVEGDGAESTFHLVEASAGPGGSITPSGAMLVSNLTDLTFTITPDPGYAISNLTENGADLGPVATHVIPGVTADTVVTATFLPVLPGLPVLAGTVTITGTPAVGAALTADTSAAYAEDGGPLGTPAFQWNRAGVPIDGATSATYTTIPADAGQPITVTFTTSELEGSLTSPAVTIQAAPLVTGETSATVLLGESHEFVMTVTTSGTIDSATITDRPADAEWAATATTGGRVVFESRAAAPGTYTFTVEFADNLGQATAVTFTILVAIDEGGPGDDDPDPTDPTDPGDPADDPEEPDPTDAGPRVETGGTLPATGASENLALLGGVAALCLLAGFTLWLTARRRATTEQSSAQ
jgi:LPXTG-motif cell wall-anchored protein